MNRRTYKRKRKKGIVQGSNILFTPHYLWTIFWFIQVIFAHHQSPIYPSYSWPFQYWITSIIRSSKLIVIMDCILAFYLLTRDHCASLTKYTWLLWTWLAVWEARKGSVTSDVISLSPAVTLWMSGLMRGDDGNGGNSDSMIASLTARVRAGTTFSDCHYLHN